MHNDMTRCGRMCCGGVQLGCRFASVVGCVLFGIATDACVLQQGTVAGRVVDCLTREPLAGATIVASESDWGWRNGGVVWDKSYLYTDVSDADGRFSVHYRHDQAAHMTIRKPGFRFTLLDTRSNNRVEIGMLPGRDTAWARSCRPSEECLKTWMENGVQHATDVCAQ
jgi:hypothetical protein